MIEKPEGFDLAPVYGTGESTQITPGGHICRIKAAAEEVLNGKRYIKIAFDVADPSDPDNEYYAKQYGARCKTSNTPTEVKWPGVYRQGIDGKSIPFFKGLLTSIEMSNPDYKWAWDEATLKGKMFGGVFGREQYEGTDGNLYWSCKCVAIRSTEGIKDVTAPEDKPMQGKAGVGASTMQPVAAAKSSAPEELPF